MVSTLCIVIATTIDTRYVVHFELILQIGLDLVLMTIAVTDIVTKTTTDVEMELLDVSTMKIAMMDITVILT